MAQLNDLLVTGASRLLNGLGILGSTNADSIFPNITDTYALGSSDKRWNTLYAKTSNIDIQTVGTLTVTNYATIGANQAATGTGTGALRVSGGISTTQNSWFGGNITTTKNISATGSGSFGGALSAATTVNINGDWETDFGLYLQEGSSNGQYGAYFLYGVNDTLKIGTMNNNDKVTAITIGRGSTNVSIAGTVTAPTFSGALSGNATTATTLKTARTLTIGNTGKSFNGSANVSWTIAEIGAVNKTGDTMTGMLTINKTQTAAVFGGSVSNISSGAYNPTAGIQICAAAGGATNSTAIGFHNPGISSASIGYYNTDANTGVFKFLSDDSNWSVNINAPITATAFNGTATRVSNNLSINGKSYNGSSTVDVGTMGIGYGGTGATNALSAFYNLNYRGGATNANNNVSVGSYYWATDCTNVPIASSYGLLYNFVSSGEAHNYSNNWIWQMGFPTSGVDLYLRSKINDSGWSGWQKMLHTGNYTSTTDSRYFTKTEIQNRGLMLNLGLNINNATAFYNMMKSQQFTVFSNWWTGSSYFPTIYASGIMFPHLDSRYRSMILGNCGNHNLYYGYYYSENINSDTTSVPNWTRIWLQGNSVTGAVWNDYAECRESDIQEPGYVLIEKGDDTLTKSTERMQPFAGVSSDTWGFSQGETERAKTHIAVAGRVLVYPYRPRDEYKPGDCVCAAPNGTVDIMTPNEVALHPDRIVGTVSCVPNYETWGGGELADRDPVQVNGRIWIKVR